MRRQVDNNALGTRIVWRASIKLARLIVADPGSKLDYVRLKEASVQVAYICALGTSLGPNIAGLQPDCPVYRRLVASLGSSHAHKDGHGL